VCKWDSTQSPLSLRMNNEEEFGAYIIVLYTLQFTVHVGLGPKYLLVQWCSVCIVTLCPSSVGKNKYIGPHCSQTKIYAARVSYAANDAQLFRCRAFCSIRARCPWDRPTDRHGHGHGTFLIRYRIRGPRNNRLLSTLCISSWLFGC